MPHNTGTRWCYSGLFCLRCATTAWQCLAECFSLWNSTAVNHAVPVHRTLQRCVQWSFRRPWPYDCSGIICRSRTNNGIGIYSANRRDPHQFTPYIMLPVVIFRLFWIMKAKVSISRKKNAMSLALRCFNMHFLVERYPGVLSGMSVSICTALIIIWFIGIIWFKTLHGWSDIIHSSDIPGP